ncbi:MAG: inositol monophosphatase family protein, partial [Planctomycetaceae bacterium]
AYCVSIALAVHNRLLVGVVHDPVAGETFSATSGGGAWLNGKRLGVSRISRLEDALAAVSFPAQATVESDAVRDFLVALPHFQAFRRSGSTALNLAWLASGRLDAFWVRRIQSWDVAAGLLLVREAGGFVTPLGDHVQTTAIQDVDLDSPAFVAAASPELVRAILELLRPEGRVTSAATAR